MSQAWSIFSAVTLLLLVQLCIGDKSCAIWSSAGPVVQRDTSFRMYCTFNCRCRGSMYSDHPPTPQSHKELNSTTIYLNVVNITKHRTYSCECKCPPLDPCGVDISAGYPPDPPINLSCIYKVLNNSGGDVLCTWNRGRDTFLRDRTVLWVRTVSANDTGEPKQHNVSSKGTDSISMSFAVLRSVQLIHVWVQAENPLGSAVSSTVNYTLSDIETPPTPVLGRPECSSRQCLIAVEQSVKTQHLEVQCNADAEQTWTSCSDQMSTVQGRSVSSLEPYMLYHFRARSKFRSGLWSQWSANISSWTQEEAPAKELDVWYAEDAADPQSARVYWQEANISIARGKIIEYKVRVFSPDSGLDLVTNLSSEARSCPVPVCPKCEVTVWARNSRGMSPPARITSRHTTAKSAQGVRVTAGGRNVTISWRTPDTAPRPAWHVVEWYPEGQRMEELGWVRLGGTDDHAVISDINPFECYEGAVYVFYNESSVSRMVFSGVSTLESAPEVGPSVQEMVKGRRVEVTWTELPRSRRRGCITNYTVYLENSRHQQRFSVAPSDKTYTTADLSPDVFSLWMTASTAAGEGPAGQQLKFLIQQESPQSILLVCGVAFLVVPLLLCLYQNSAVNQKFRVFFHCLMFDVVPDPANSKWAKECTQEKGRMNLQLQLSNPGANEEEEEPILVEVEELPRRSSGIAASTTITLQPPPQINLSPGTEPPVAPLYPLTTYIKSFSHDSDSSDHTQTSLDTSTTVDYISSHGLADEDEDEDDDYEETEEMLGFFPSQNVFLGSTDFGGKLTLDAVKINFCSNLFQNS